MFHIPYSLRSLFFTKLEKKMKILAISGRKQSGKTTLANFLIRTRKEFFGNDDTVLCLGWATALKQELSDKFDIPLELLDGTDEDKNVPTMVRWKDLAHFSELNMKELGKEPEDYLTIRQLLQHWGTEINRRANNNVWINLAMKQVKRGNYGLVIFNDTRFSNEVEAVHKAGGKVVRLTRNGKMPATHDSEVSLDRDKFDWSKFDGIIDNEHMSISGKERVMVNLLEQWGWKNLGA